MSELSAMAVLEAWRLRASLVSALLLVTLPGCDKPGGDTKTTASPVSAAAPGSAIPSASSPAAVSAEAPKKPAEPPTFVTAQHVLVAWKGAERCPKGISRTKVEAKKRAEEVAGKAKAGGDFSALVAEYSDDPAAKERMGSVGKFTRDKMAKPFSDAAFSLAVGESSEPVETPFGYHVIKRNQ